MAASSAPPKPTHRKRNIAIVLVVGGLALVLALLWTIPVSTSYSMTLTATASTHGVSTLSPPSGAHVTGSFSTTDQRSVTFEILDSNMNVVYSVSAASGSFSFLASSPPYTFEAITDILSHTVDVAGSYSAPIL
jgi:hypothetical protein